MSATREEDADAAELSATRGEAAEGAADEPAPADVGELAAAAFFVAAAAGAPLAPLRIES